jgi:hypothetical protein
MLLTNIHIFIHVRLNFFHGVKSHGVYLYTFCKYIIIIHRKHPDPIQTDIFTNTNRSFADIKTQLKILCQAIIVSTQLDKEL